MLTKQLSEQNKLEATSLSKGLQRQRAPTAQQLANSFSPLPLLKDTEKALHIVEHGHAGKEASQLHHKQTEGYRQRDHHPAGREREMG